MNQLRTIDHIATTVSRHHACGDQKPVRKDGRLIDLSVAVRILTNQNLVRSFLPRFEVRINFAACYPESTLLIEIHLNGLGNLWIPDEQIDVKSFHNLEALTFYFGTGVRNIRKVSLSVHRSNKAGEHQNHDT